MDFEDFTSLKDSKKKVAIEVDEVCEWVRGNPRLRERKHSALKNLIPDQPDGRSL